LGGTSRPQCSSSNRPIPCDYTSRSSCNVCPVFWPSCCKSCLTHLAFSIAFSLPDLFSSPSLSHPLMSLYLSNFLICSPSTRSETSHEPLFARLFATRCVSRGSWMPSSTVCRSCSSSKPSNPCPCAAWWDPGSPLSRFSPICSIRPEPRLACAPCKNARTAPRLSLLLRATMSWHGPGYDVSTPYTLS
jgi:hypothetical protein